MDEQKTRDITLATILYTKGAKLEGHEKTRSGNIVFYFKKTKDLERLIEAYYRGEDFVFSPQNFMASFKFLKSIIRKD